MRAAHLAVLAGADGITAHLREDRRHIRDEDIERLKREILAPLNFEIAPTAEMIAIAARVRPHAACLVPEKREERTTEGGLDIVGGHDHLAPVVHELREIGIRVSLFVEPEVEVMEAARGAARSGGRIAHRQPIARRARPATTGASLHELERLQPRRRARRRGSGSRSMPGTASPSTLSRAVAAIPQIVELNIGHFLIGEAVFIGPRRGDRHHAGRDGRGTIPDRGCRVRDDGMT